MNYEFEFFITGLIIFVRKPIEVKKNTSIFVPSGIQRGWNNTGTADFKVLVIKDLA